MADLTNLHHKLGVPKTLVITFDEPIPDGSGKTVESIKLRSPTFGEARQADKRGAGSLDEMLCLIATIASVKETVVNQMPLWQVEEAGSFLMSFSKAAKKIGTTSAGTPLDTGASQ
jgi:hypothetical protein